MGEEKNGEEEGHREDMDLDLLHIDPSSFNGNIHQLKKGINIPDFEACSNHSFKSRDSQLLQTDSIIETMDRDDEGCNILTKANANETIS
eukprot:scaffold11473_cov544-Chaetoceros_neogracile.AAC.1